MEIVWASDPLTVREVVQRIEGRPAYTTVMTTLDRLFRKKLLKRTKDGTAYVYRAAMSRDDYHRAVVEEAVGGLLEEAAAPVMAAFVDTAAKGGDDNLRELEKLIADYRKRTSCE